MAANTHLGPWRDDPAAALAAALGEVNVEVGDFVTCALSDGVVLHPVDPAGPTVISGSFRFSEARQQYRVNLSRTPNVVDHES